MEEVLIPALTKIVNLDLYPMPINFAHASRNGIGHASLRLETDEVNLVIAEMRKIILEDEDRTLDRFSAFFFTIANHGEKFKVPVNIEDMDNKELLKKCCRFISLNWDILKLNQLFVDLAIVLCRPPHSDPPVTGLWKDYNYLRGLFFPVNDSSRFVGEFRKDDMCGFTGLGGFKYSPSGESKGSSGIVSMQCYCLLKTIDFKRNNTSFRQSKDIKPLDLVNNSKKVKPWAENLCSDLDAAVREHRSYGVRLEFRVCSVKLKDLLTTLVSRQMIRKLSKAIRFFPTHSLLAFIKYRLMACTIANRTYQKSMTRSSFSGLTLACILSYFFSSLLHRPMDTHGMSFVDVLIKDNKLATSKCMMIPDLIRMETQNWSVRLPLSEHELTAIFGNSIVSQCLSVVTSDPPTVPMALINAGNRSASGGNRATGGNRSTGGSRVTGSNNITGINVERLWNPPTTMDIEYHHHIQILQDIQPSASYRYHDLRIPSLEDATFGVLSSEVKRNLSSSDNFHRMGNMIMVFGMGEQGVKLAAQLVMSDLVFGYTTWHNKVKDEYAFNGDKKACNLYMRDKVGDKLFKSGGLEIYLKPEGAIYTDQRYFFTRSDRPMHPLEAFVLPSVSDMVDKPHHTIAFNIRSNWKTLGARAYLLSFFYYFADSKKEEVEKFRKNIIDYIRTNYDCIPKMAKDKIYNFEQSKIVFLSMPNEQCNFRLKNYGW